MDAFEPSILIERPIEETFAVLANLENDVKWHSAFVEVRNTTVGPNGVGARFLVFEGPFGRPIVAHWTKSSIRTAGEPGI